jgi:peptidoglycan/LPS O-acetylase OafA/YrhL
MKRSVRLDILRAACALFVVIGHYSPFFLPQIDDPAAKAVSNVFWIGSFGVTGFFVLSSYLLTRIMLRIRETQGERIWRGYFARRVLRIWPLYFTVFLASLIICGIAGIDMAGAWSLPTFTYNWTAWQSTNQWIGHFWSMCAEEQFYLLIPLLCLMPNRLRMLASGLLFIIAPISRYWVGALLPYPAVWNFTSSHLDAFALGVMIASLDHHGGPRWTSVRNQISRSTWSLSLVVTASVAIVLLAANNPLQVLGSPNTWYTMLLVALIAAWVLMRSTTMKTESAVVDEVPTGRVARLMVWLGVRSYGIYVFHWPGRMAGMWVVTTFGVYPPVAGLLFLAITIVVSYASYRWLELPFLRQKKLFQ